jgi:hypothetical protein
MRTSKVVAFNVLRVQIHLWTFHVLHFDIGSGWLGFLFLGQCEPISAYVQLLKVRPSCYPMSTKPQNPTQVDLLTADSGRPTWTALQAGFLWPGAVAPVQPGG